MRRSMAKSSTVQMHDVVVQMASAERKVGITQVPSFDHLLLKAGSILVGRLKPCPTLLELECSCAT